MAHPTQARSTITYWFPYDGYAVEVTQQLNDMVKIECPSTAHPADRDSVIIPAIAYDALIAAIKQDPWSEKYVATDVHVVRQGERWVMFYRSIRVLQLGVREMVNLRRGICSGCSSLEELRLQAHL